MVKDLQRKRKVVVAVCGDIVVVIAAYLLCFIVRSITTFPLGEDLIPLNRFQHLPHHWEALVCSQFVMLFFLGFYDQVWGKSINEIVFQLVAGCAVQTLFLGTYYGFASQSIFPRTIFPLFLVFNTVLLFFWRSLLRSLFGTRSVRRVLLVGVNDAAARLTRIIEEQKALGLEVIGLVTHDEGKHTSVRSVPGDEGVSMFCGRPVLGSLEDLDRLIEVHGADEVILSSGVSWQSRIIDTLGKNARSDLRLSLLPNVYEILIGKPRHLKIRDVPLIEVSSDPNPMSRLLVKRLLDLLFASFFLVLTAPVFFVVALLIKISSPGPVFYTQERVGRNGRIFTVIKFRTMIQDAEKESGATLSTEADPRVTAVGRILRQIRIDELPQLINVLRGDMSFIGPRPERPVFVQDFVRTVTGYSQRHRIKPGITGLAQINGFYDTDTENKLKYDLYYIQNYSLWLDFLIVVETLKTMIARKGV